MMPLRPTRQNSSKPRRWLDLAIRFALGVTTFLPLTPRAVGARQHLPAQAMAEQHGEGSARQHRTDKQTVVVGVSQLYRPLSWVSEDGTPQGLAVEAFRAAAKAVGLQVTFRAIAFTEQRDALVSGSVDALACLPVTDEWIAGAAYAQPILISDGVIYSRRGSPSKTSATQLRGQRVGVSKYGPEHVWLAEQGVTPTLVAQTVRELMTDLAEGRIDYLATARFRGRLALSEMSGKAEIVETPIESAGFRSSYAAIFQQGDTALLADINDALTIIRERGEFDRLYAANIGALQPRPDPPGTISSRVAAWSGAAALGVLALAGLWQWSLRSQLARRTRELAASEGKYRGFFENCQDAVLIADPTDGRILEGNDAARAMYGYSLDELARLSIAQITTDLESAQRAIKEVMTSNRVSTIRCEHLRKDGTRFPVEINATTADIAGRRLVVTFIRDISERVRAEMALLVDQANYRNIFHDAGTGILVAHHESGVILEANRAAGRMYGVARERLAGSHLGAYLRTSEGVIAERNIGGLNWDAVAGRHRHTRADGTMFDAEVRASAVQFMNQPARLLIVQDISARLRAEEDRLALEAQLAQAQKLEGLGLLAGGIAHDFNNLLVGIMGNADMALAGIVAGRAEDPRLPEILNEILAASRHASDLTHQLLAYAGRVRYLPERVELAAICAECVRLLGARIHGDVRVEIVPQVEPIAVNADPVLLRQVVSNLLVNASDSFDGNPGVVRVSFGAHRLRDGLARLGDDRMESPAPAQDPLPPGEYAWFEIADSGCGIEPGRLGTIFDPFVSTKKTGRGLGLAVALSVVRRHGGAIRVRSSPGKGSAFRVLLPARVGGTAGHSTVATGGDAGNLGGAPRMGRALLADDEPRVLDVTRRLLETKGWQVRAVGDGATLLELLRSDEPFDAVVIDAIMPGPPGTEVVRAARAIRPGTPIVTVSGYSPDHLGDHGATMGADAFVQKPFTIEELLEGISRARSHPYNAADPAAP